MKIGKSKSLLRTFGVRVTGNREEILERIFVPMENSVSVFLFAENMEKKLIREYGNKLYNYG